MRHILIIDDDQLTASALMVALKAEDRNILAVSGAHRALSEVRSMRYDLVFLEMSLSDRSGMSVLEEVNRSAPSTCVVAMSADILDRDVEDAIIDHDHFFLPKPFEVLQVRTMVKRILLEQRLAREWAPRKSERDEDRRQWPRSTHFEQVVCTPDPGSAGIGVSGNFSAEVADVSHGGIGLRTDHPVPPGQRVRFRGETAVWEGIVRWSLVFGSRFRAGVEFV